MNTPDIYAPRYRPPVYTTTNTKAVDAIRKKVSPIEKVTREQVRKIVFTCNQHYVDKCIENRDGIELPEFIGYIMIGLCKPKSRGPNLNFALSHKHGVIVKNTNFETDRYWAKIFYESAGNKYSFVHSRLWGFEPSRIFKRKVSKIFPEKYNSYKFLEPDIRINKIYKKQVTVNALRKINKIKLEDFNELEF